MSGPDFSRSAWYNRTIDWDDPREDGNPFRSVSSADWMVEAARLAPGGRINFRRGLISIQDVAAAIDRQFPDGDVVLHGWHGDVTYVERLW